MKKALIALASVALMLLAACSSPQPRTIENPSIAATNGNTIDVTKVELNDSATVLTIHAQFRPGWWIQLAPESHIVADGKDYAIVNAEGIELGQQFTMPESGEADFTLTFAPVPLDTKSIDFTEGTPEGWTLYGIDVTGNPAAAPLYPAALPKEARDIDLTNVDIEPVLEVAPTELRIHVPAWRPEYGKTATVYLQNMNESSKVDVEPDANGEGTVTPILYGPTSVSFSGGDIKSLSSENVLVAPGVATDIYVAPEFFSDFILNQRDPENFKPTTSYLYDNGHYAALNRAKSNMEGYGMDINFDWHMNGDQFTAALIEARDNAKAKIAASNLPEGAKQYACEIIDVEALDNMENAWGILANKYYREKGEDGIRDSVKIEFSPENYASVAKGFDTTKKSYLLQPWVISTFTPNPRVGLNWADYGITGGIFSDIPTYSKAYGRAKAAKLDAADIARLENLSDPFYAKAAKTLNDESTKLYEVVKQKTTANPDVPADQLFDAIVAPHKGKVVLVDLWNTWCGPCRNALKANEPLKTGELADDDIVWIYIADESSDVNDYIAMLPNIKGEHHMVSPEQIAAIRSRFNVDGIPFYILVDRNGKAVGHPDFRNHSKLVEGIKGAL